MFINFFDMFILGFLVFAIVMFLMGKGDTLMHLFGGKTNNVADEYNREKLDRASLIFCVFMLINELILIFIGKKYPVMSAISLALTVAAFVIYVWYIRKYAKK